MLEKIMMMFKLT